MALIFKILQFNDKKCANHLNNLVLWTIQIVAPFKRLCCRDLPLVGISGAVFIGAFVSDILVKRKPRILDACAVRARGYVLLPAFVR